MVVLSSPKCLVPVVPPLLCSQQSTILFPFLAQIKNLIAILTVFILYNTVSKSGGLECSREYIVTVLNFLVNCSC